MGGHQKRQALRSLLRRLQRLRRMETRRNNNSNTSKLNKTSTNSEDLQINNNLYIIVHFNKTTSPCFDIFIFQFEAEKQSFSVSLNLERKMPSSLADHMRAMLPSILSEQ